jgi:hypothetical protein
MFEVSLKFVFDLIMEKFGFEFDFFYLTTELAIELRLEVFLTWGVTPLHPLLLPSCSS